MLSSFSTFQSLTNYAGSSASSGPATGKLKISNFVAGNSTTSIVNQYSGLTGQITGSNLIVQSSNLSSIASSAGIVNAVQFNIPPSTSSSNRVMFNGAFTFDSSVAMTISAWVYCPGSNGLSSGDIKVFEGDASERMLLWQQGSAQNNFNFNNTGSFTLNFGVWNHVVCVMTRTGNKQDFYINGVYSTAGSGTIQSGWGLPGSTTSISSLAIGRSLSTLHYSFYGFVTDYRWYPRALTQTEVSAIYAGAV